jgi:hypothetical protein
MVIQVDPKVKKIECLNLPMREKMPSFCHYDLEKGLVTY